MAKVRKEGPGGAPGEGGLRGSGRSPGFQLFVLQPLPLGHGCVVQPVLLDFLLEGFFSFVCMEKHVHKKDIHTCDPHGEFFLLFILGFLFSVWKKV